MTTASLARLSKEKAEEIIKLYMEGRSQTYIEKELKCTKKTIRSVLSRKGILRTKEEQTKYIHVGTTLREDAFDIIDDTSAYWLGFLYADGYITNPENTTAIGLQLKKSDTIQVEKFKEFLKAPQNIFFGETTLQDKTYEYVKLKIGSQRLHARLTELGFTHNKSNDATPPEFLKYNRHFWRGVIDGDGYVGIVDGYPRVHICGTKATVQGLKDFVIQSGIPTEQVVRKENDKSLHTFYVGSEKAKVLGKILYSDTKDYLDRKMEMFKSFPEEIQLFIGK